MSKKRYNKPTQQPAQSAAVTSPAAVQAEVQEVQEVQQPADLAACPEEEMVIQFGENEVDVCDISEKVKEDYRQNGNDGEICHVKIYVKPEDNKAYYVIDDVEGNIDLV